MTREDLDLIARFCDGITHHYDEDRARIRRLLDAYEAEHRAPVTADDAAPLDVAPDWWDARRERLGKPDKSTCAAELRRALFAAGLARSLCPTCKQQRRIDAVSPTDAVRAKAEEVFSHDRALRDRSNPITCQINERLAFAAYVKLAPDLARELLAVLPKAQAFDRLAVLIGDHKDCLRSTAWHVALQLKDIVESVTHEWALPELPKAGGPDAE